MKCIFLGLVLSMMSAPAFANINGYIWAYNTQRQIACFPANALAQPAVDSVSVDGSYCQFSYAWGRDAANNIACFAVGASGTFLPGYPAAAPASCAKAYLWARDNQGMIRCFGQGADGNTLVNSFSVDNSFCTTQLHH